MEIERRGPKNEENGKAKREGEKVGGAEKVAGRNYWSLLNEVYTLVTRNSQLFFLAPSPFPSSSFFFPNSFISFNHIF